MKALFAALFTLCVALLVPSGVSFAQSGAEPHEAMASAPPPGAYALGPGDEVRITVFNEPDLSVEQRISAEGEINLPLVGDLQAGGMTTTQLSDAIEERLRQGYLRNPRVSVTALTYRPFYVIGEVARPGAYPFSADLTVAGAIATAGGFARGASRSRVYVQRAGSLQEEQLSVQENVALNPGDTVRVGQSALSGLRDLPLGLLGLLP